MEKVKATIKEIMEIYDIEKDVDTEVKEESSDNTNTNEDMNNIENDHMSWEDTIRYEDKKLEKEFDEEVG